MYHKTGYLDEQLRLFYLSEQIQRIFPYHYHDFDKVILFLHGKVTYEIEGKSYTPLPYDVILVPAGQVHRLTVQGPESYERLIAYISPLFWEQYRSLGCDLSLIFTQAHSHVLRQPQEDGDSYGTACRLHRAYHENTWGSNLLQQSLFLEFMIHLARSVQSQHIRYVKIGRQNEKIQAILSYINTHLSDDLTIPAIASTFYISPDYLMHAFKHDTGYSLGDYITTKRLLLARARIQQGSTLTTVCYDCGFKNYSTFYRAWKKHFHQSPRKGIQAKLYDGDIWD